MGDVSLRVFNDEGPVAGGECIFTVEHKGVKELPGREGREQPAAYPCRFCDKVSKGSEMCIKKFKSSCKGIDCKGNAGL